jgi:electron transport complex protein RnfC
MTTTWVTPGGIHPAENKNQSLTLPIGELPIPYWYTGVALCRCG